jgi:CRISPR-associated endoribonuclease Cas6
MELLSIVLSLRALDDIADLRYTGYQAQGWLLGQIRENAPLLANQIHPPSPDKGDGRDELTSHKLNIPDNDSGQAEKSGIRPYTISGLMRGSVHPTHIAKGDRCWIRFSTYEQNLSNLFAHIILPKIRSEILALGRHGFLIEDWTDDGTKHEWAGKASYQMLNHWSQSNIDQSFGLEFCSPTHFKSKKMDVPLPIPWMVFKSHWRQWEKYSGCGPDVRIEEFIEDCVALSEAKIQSEITFFPLNSKRKPERGFTGRCVFSIIHNQKDKWSQADFVYYGNMIRRLAVFSFYCGTGHHTTIGLGRTRLI